MKKIFTLLLTIMALLSSTSVSAQTQDIKIRIYNNTDGVSVTYKNKSTTLTKNEDGTWTIANFVGSGSPLTFSFDVPLDSNSYSKVTIASDQLEVEEGYEDYPYLLTTDGDYMTCQVTTGTSYGSEKVNLYWTTTDTGTYYDVPYPYVAINKNSNYENDYYMYMDLAGYNDDYDYLYLYIYVYFNKVETSGISDVISSNNAPVEYYNINGIRVENPTNGLYISKQGNEVKKVIIK